MKIKLTEYEKETLSYDDVAYLIIKNLNKKMKIQDLFKKVIETLELPANAFEENITDFFEQLVTDKRFIMLDKGYCDLKTNHSTNVIIEDDDDFDVILTEDSIDDDSDYSNEDNYDDDSNADDDSENDLQDLVIIDETDDPDSEMS